MGFLNAAVREIARLPETTLLSVSSVYETEPYGLKDQEGFLNAAAELETALSPADLHERLKEIESRLGRTTTERWGPREIDIDILFYGSRTLSGPDLTVPHPEIAMRRFVLVPLSEIAGTFRDPHSGLFVSELLSRCSDTGSVQKTGLRIVQPSKEQ